MNMLEAFLLLWQVATNMQHLRADVRGNAAAHAAALRNGADFAPILAEVAAAGAQYKRRISWLEALLGDPTQRAVVAYAAAPWPDAMAEIDRQAAEARGLMEVWDAHPKASREDLLALCDLVPQLVTPPRMLWPT